ncbi:integrase [bacterium endosymbiont of Mortierella elongata FMR23-6]|nr:integrase [bacterium endosymbiont of Mortierella elongata FMR23-6]
MQGDLAGVIDRIRVRRRGYKVISPFLILNENGERLTADALRFRFDAAREAAGVSKQDFQFRDLRAKAGTDKEERYGMAAAKDQLGHSDEKMTQRYVRHRKGKLVTPTR